MIIKHLVNRPRPFITYPFIEKVTGENSPSFPSGHTSDAFTLAISLSFFFPKWYVITPSFLWAFAVGYSRMDLGVHYPSDILGSVIIAIISGAVCYYFLVRRRETSLTRVAEKIPLYVIQLFKKHQLPALLYHNLNHTKAVVRRTNEIATHYSLNPVEQFILSTAAWFHDTGHLFTKDNHEDESVSVMWNYLKRKCINIEIVSKIEKFILSTKIPQTPKSFLEEILCDADTYNLGNQDFLITDKLLKRESELRGTLPNENWDKNTLKFLEHHAFFTDYCRLLLDAGKQKNIAFVRSVVKQNK